jgi:hypothetical protein
MLTRPRNCSTLRVRYRYWQGPINRSVPSVPAPHRPRCCLRAAVSILSSPHACAARTPRAVSTLPVFYGVLPSFSIEYILGCNSCRPTLCYGPVQLPQAVCARHGNHNPSPSPCTIRSRLLALEAILCNLFAYPSNTRTPVSCSCSPAFCSWALSTPHSPPHPLHSCTPVSATPPSCTLSR